MRFATTVDVWGHYVRNLTLESAILTSFSGGCDKITFLRAHVYCSVSDLMPSCTSVGWAHIVGLCVHFSTLEDFPIPPSPVCPSLIIFCPLYPVSSLRDQLHAPKLHVPMHFPAEMLIFLYNRTVASCPHSNPK